MTIDKQRPAAQDHAAAQGSLVQALSESLRAAGPASPPQLIETHISYVLLTGGLAYKIKKAVDFGFLDFSTLALRRHYCFEELRLNRRLAAAIYLDVVAIRGTPAAPRIDAIDAVGRADADADAGAAAAPAIEYAIRMREFPQTALFDRMLARGALAGETMDALAARLADFHASATRSPPRPAIGSARLIRRLAADNFGVLDRLAKAPAERRVLSRLQGWSRAQAGQLSGFFAQRRADGYVREGHGDLHLGNIALVDGLPLAFDCIEFSVPLRWIDVIDEIAFLVMDVHRRGHADLAWRFINAYLEHSGDYAGLRGLPFYFVYRALVRAKIAALRAVQQETAAPGDAWADCRRHLACARRATARRRCFMLLMHGVCATGKTRAAEALGARLHVVRLRSDVERKRVHGRPALASSAAPPHQGIYDRAGDQATYQRLAQLADAVLAAGFPVLIDAACLEPWQRDLLRRVGERHGMAVRIVSCQADTATLRQRVAARAAAGNDASDADLAVLAAQLRDGAPLAEDEAALTIVFDSTRQSHADLVQRVADSLDDSLDGA